MLRTFTKWYLIWGILRLSDTVELKDKPGPQYIPSKGEIWPKPQFQNKLNTVFVYRPANFQVKIVQYTCDILKSTINRNFVTLRELVFIKNENLVRLKPIQNLTVHKHYIRKLQVNLTSKCEVLPHFNMDESYYLSVSENSILSSNSIWGILRGFETFIQLFYLADDYSNVLINGIQINDYPKYKHRGLLIDTARHYFSVKTIQKIIRAMAMNKLNVLHWHIVDDQSFPYESKYFPKLSEKGAFTPSSVYRASDIRFIIKFARYHGIRVIPEFDVPGHTRSWGLGQPVLLTECHNLEQKLGPLNPIFNLTYIFLKVFFDEISYRFPDQFLHIGGDEVDLSCWENNAEIQIYMFQHNLEISDVFNEFIQNTLSVLPSRVIPIVWQEVFDNGGLTQKSFVQVWKYGWLTEIIQLMSAGHFVIFSSSWYLDSGEAWQKFYLEDPRLAVIEFTKSYRNLDLIVGGEACLWSEFVDDSNALNSIFPKTAAVAERLWTGLDYTKSTSNKISLNVLQRIEEHWCRMKRRGIPTTPPNGPGFCVTRNKNRK